MLPYIESAISVLGRKSTRPPRADHALSGEGRTAFSGLPRLLVFLEADQNPFWGRLHRLALHRRFSRVREMDRGEGTRCHIPEID